VFASLTHPNIGAIYGLEEQTDVVSGFSRTIHHAVAESSVKVLGRRTPSRGGLLAAAPFLDLAIRLHDGRPFIPRGVAPLP